MKVDQQLKPIQREATQAAKPLRNLADDYMIEGEIGEVIVDTDAHYEMVAADLLSLKKDADSDRGKAGRAFSAS